MQELTTLHSDTMSSRELLTIINLSRAEFAEPPVRLNDFNNRVVDELDGYHYETFVVKNPNGTQSTEHHLTIDQCILVGMRESKAVRRKVLEKLTDMKQQQIQQPTQPIGETEDKLRAYAYGMTLLNIDDVSKQAYVANAIEQLTGVSVPYRPQLEQKTYSATEIGNQLNVSANKVGRIANAHGLKTSEYGVRVLDKAKGHDKQVETFRYYANTIPIIRAILENE